MKLTVMDHNYDEDAGVYRLVVGTPVEHVVPLQDEEGNGLAGEDGEPMTETVTEMVALEDFVFAADDRRWKNKSPETVATAQRKLVREALAAREQEAADQAAAATDLTEMPGVGDAL